MLSVIRLRVIMSVVFLIIIFRVSLCQMSFTVSHMLRVILLSFAYLRVIMLSVIMPSRHYAKYHFTDCRLLLVFISIDILTNAVCLMLLC